MQFFLTLAAVVAVAVATPVHRALITPGPAGPAPIIEEPGQGIAIGPAVIDFSPISVGPAIVEQNPISVGPAIIDFPLPDGGAVVEEPVILPAPAIVEPAVVAENKPVIQIIVNINAADLESSSPIAPAPVDAGVVAPGPVNVVDNVVDSISPVVVVNPVAPGPVNVVDNVVPAVVTPVQVAEPIVPGPVNVVDGIAVSPVVVGTPIIPAPVVVLPETLN